MGKWPLINSITKNTLNETTDENEEINDPKKLIEPRKLSPLEMTEIQKKIRKGAKDIDEKWASAIDLTNTAYKHLGQEIPNSPANGEAWDCYQENIEHAVEMLAKYRGLDDQTWRLSDAPDEF